MEVNIGILGKGDEVVNVFPYGESIAVAVRRKSRNVEIVLVKKNAEGLLVIDGKLTICEGDGSVEAVVGKTKITTF